MKVLGKGKANGAISILHSLGLGKGCSIGIGLSTEVSLVDEKTTISNDRHGLLSAVETCWRSEGLPFPEEFGWVISSDLPIGQGLKSSSALANAAFRALNAGSWTGLSDPDIADLSVAAQRIAKCTVTGSMDDTWASLQGGWKLVDPTLSSSDSIILEGEIEEDYCVIIILRGRRRAIIAEDSFRLQGSIFERSLASIISGSPIDSLSSNGMAVAAATNDHLALRISNSLIASGAVASGITGSGPSICVLCYEESKNMLRDKIHEMGLETISTRLSRSSVLEEEATGWE